MTSGAPVAFKTWWRQAYIRLCFLKSIEKSWGKMGQFEKQ
jgi:hypothetical protein